MRRARRAGDGRESRQLSAAEQKPREEFGWRAASQGGVNDLTEAEKVRPNQTMKGPKMETGRGRQRARQEGAKKQRVLGHALHEAANI